MIPGHPVTKTLTDIRGVWNFTGDGVNPSIYTPPLFLPAANTLYSHIEVDMEQEYLDVKY